MAGLGKLVSVIIPCYNNERWVGEAISSCLEQTYRPIEIIVVDDGSTDGSLDVLQAFGAQIQWESGPHRGACYARNRGFSLTRGEYIQFLDSDDYLSPEKIVRQVAFLEETGAGVVYGDWRHQYHDPGGSVELGEIKVPGIQADILEALLGGWWSANMTLLLRRKVVLQCGGWDESLGAGQDRDFFISVALSGADIRYQFGCHSFYRRYGNVTLSTASIHYWLENQSRLLGKVESRLEDTRRLTPVYRRALAQSYFDIARNYYDIDRSKYALMLEKALSLNPSFRPGGSSFYRWVQRMFGFKLADQLASRKRRISQALRDYQKPSKPSKKISSAGNESSSMQGVLFIQYTNSAAFPPLEHISRILAGARWQVMFLGIGAPGIESLSFPPHDRIVVRQMSYCLPGWRQKVHYLRFTLWVLWWAVRWRTDWVYASDLLSCPAALLLSFLPGVRVIYHEHDSPGSTNGSFSLRLSMLARRKLAHRANMCVLPNERRAERFDSEVLKLPFNGHQPSIVVWNCPSLEELSEPRPAHDGGDLCVLYHGTIVPPRLPHTVLEALALLPESVKLYVIGYETIDHRGYVGELQKTAERLGLRTRVQFPGPYPRKELLKWCRECDVGLAFMPKVTDDINLQEMVGASNKPFDYLSCGLALLVSDLPDWRAMYVETGYGLACEPDDRENIAAALRWFLDNPVDMRAMGERGRRKIAEEWNYENQFSPVLERMSGL